MARAHTTDHTPDEELFEQRRQAERRRWFERLVMIPVSLGMLVAFAGGAARDFLHTLNAQASIPVERAGAETAIASALVAGSAFVISLLRWLRK